MKKSLWGAILVLLLAVGVTAKFYGDSTRFMTVGSPITLIDDTAYINVFPSRLQSFPSAAFCGVAGNAVFVPGLALVTSDMFGILYLYGMPAGTVPAMATNSGLAPAVLPGITAMAQPVNLMYGMKADKLQLGLGYSLIYYDQSAKTTMTNGDYASVVSAYYLHGFTPSITLLLSEKSSLDASVNVVLQFLNNQTQQKTGDVITNYNIYKPASVLSTLGANVQYNTAISEKTKLSVRVAASMADAGYNFTNPGVTNDIGSKTFNIGLNAGLRYMPVDFLTIFFDLTGGMREVYTTSFANGVESLAARTDTTTFTMFPSSRLGAEGVYKTAGGAKWSFRMGLNYTLTVVKAVGFDPTFNAVTSAPTSALTTFLGIGYGKLPWSINMQINPALFNDTLAVLSTAAGSQPVLRVSVNYVFFTGKQAERMAAGGDKK